MLKRMTISEIHAMKYELLCYIDFICKKENITYYLAYGTLLGAVREKGYIPWDEDIDLWMTKEELGRFVNAYKKYENLKYFLQTEETDPYYYGSVVRLCINGTARVWDVKEYSNADNHSHQGTFIDIFTMDRVNGWSSTNVFLLNCLSKVMDNYFENINTIKHLRYRILHMWIRVVPFKWYRRLYKFLIEKNEKKDGSLYRSITWGYGTEKALFSRELFADTVYLTFENKEFPCPIGYDKLLTQIYGNYMIRPKHGEEKKDASSYWIE